MWNLKKAELLQSRMVITRGWQGGRNGEMLAKKYTLLVKDEYIAGFFLMHTSLNMVNNTILHIESC